MVDLDGRMRAAVVTAIESHATSRINSVALLSLLLGCSCTDFTGRTLMTVTDRSCLSIRPVMIEVVLLGRMTCLACPSVYLSAPYGFLI